MWILNVSPFSDCPSLSPYQVFFSRDAKLPWSLNDEIPEDVEGFFSSLKKVFIEDVAFVVDKKKEITLAKMKELFDIRRLRISDICLQRSVSHRKFGLGEKVCKYVPGSGKLSGEFKAGFVVVGVSGSLITLSRESDNKIFEENINNVRPRTTRFGRQMPLDYSM